MKKFPEFAVDVNQDKKSLKTAMDNAFHQLKVLGTNEIGKELYVLLWSEQNFSHYIYLKIYTLTLYLLWSITIEVKYNYQQ